MVGGARGSIAFGSIERIRSWRSKTKEKRAYRAPITLVEIALIVLGIVVVAYRGIPYTGREKVIDIGPVQASVDTKEDDAGFTAFDRLGVGEWRRAGRGWVRSRLSGTEAEYDRHIAITSYSTDLRGVIAVEVSNADCFMVAMNDVGKRYTAARGLALLHATGRSLHLDLSVD